MSQSRSPDFDVSRVIAVLTAVNSLILTVCGVVFYLMATDRAWFEDRGEITLQNLTNLLFGSAAGMILVFVLGIIVRIKTGKPVPRPLPDILPLIGLMLGFSGAWLVSGEVPFSWGL
jgi:zinc transporter ZupT